MAPSDIWNFVWDAATGMVGRAVFFGFIGLVFSIMLLIVLGYKGLFKRENRVWNIFAKLTYVYVPVVFLAMSGMLGFASGGHQAANRSIDTLCVYSTKIIPSFKSYLDRNWDEVEAEATSLEETAGRFFKKFHFEPETGGWFDQKKAAIINYFTMNAGKWIIVGLATVVVSKAGETVGLSESDTRAALKLIKEMDVSNVEENFFQILAEALKKTIGRWFKSLYIGIVMNLFLLLLVPTVETAIYFGLKRRKARRASPAVVGDE